MLGGSWNPARLPNLTDQNCEIKSLYDTKYNCIAFAAGETESWWWPTDDDYWPDGVDRQVTIEVFIKAFATKGYLPCEDGTLDETCEKVALYGMDDGSGRMVPTHAAIQLPDGKWASKLGKCEDIHHATVDAVNGPSYGVVVRYLKRDKDQKRAPDPTPTPDETASVSGPESDANPNHREDFTPLLSAAVKKPGRED
jgi:hypothetical protein